MAKIVIALQIPLDTLVKGTKEEYLKEVVKSAEDKYKSYQKTTVGQILINSTLNFKKNIMTNEELIKELKILIYEETEDEVDDIREAFNLGIMDNMKLYESISELIEYYKNK